MTIEIDHLTAAALLDLNPGQVGVGYFAGTAILLARPLEGGLLLRNASSSHVLQMMGRGGKG